MCARAWTAEGIHKTVGKKKGIHCYSETVQAAKVKWSKLQPTQFSEDKPWHFILMYSLFCRKNIFLNINNNNNWKREKPTICIHFQGWSFQSKSCNQNLVRLTVITQSAQALSNTFSLKIRRIAWVMYNELYQWFHVCEGFFCQWGEERSALHWKLITKMAWGRQLLLKEMEEYADCMTGERKKKKIKTSCWTGGHH